MSLFRPRWPWAVLGVAIVFVMAWYGIVYGHWTAGPVRFITRVIPFPAVVLNGEPITYHAVLKKMDLLFWLADEQNEGTRLPDDEELLSQALDSLLRQEAIEQIAAKEDVEVSRDELRAALASLQGEEDDEAFAARIAAAVNRTIGEFEDEILRPLILAQNLETFILSSASYQSQIRALAEQAQVRIDGGHLFGTILDAALSSSFSIEGGDYGYIARENMPEGWNHLLSMSENSTSPVIETSEDFVVLVVEDVIGDGESAQYHTKAILFHKRSLNEVVEEYLDESYVKEVIRGVADL